MPTALSVALRPPFSFQQVQYAQVFPLKPVAKLTFGALNLFNNKQCVHLPLTIPVFDKGTIAAIKNFLFQRSDMTAFLTLINNWWTIIHAKKWLCSNLLENAFVKKMAKLNFCHFSLFGTNLGVVHQIACV